MTKQKDKGEEERFALTVRSALGGVVKIGDHKIGGKPVTFESLTRAEVDLFYVHRGDLAVAQWPTGWQPQRWPVVVRAIGFEAVGAAGHAFGPVPINVDASDVDLGDLYRARRRLLVTGWPKGWRAPDGTIPADIEAAPSPEPAALPLPASMPSSGWPVTVHARTPVDVGRRRWSGTKVERVDSLELVLLAVAHDRGDIDLVMSPGFEGAIKLARAAQGAPAAP